MTGFRIDDAAWTGRWRRRSVAEKAVLALGLLLVAVTSASATVTAATLGCTLVLALGAARVPPGDFLRAAAGPLLFIGLGAVTVTVTFGPGTDPVWQWGPLEVESGAPQRAGLVALRACAGVAAMLLLAMTTPLSDLLAGLRRLRVPGPLVDVAALMYRMVFGLLHAATAVRESQTARLGYVTAGAARRSVGLLAAATLRRAWLRAQRLEEGLAGRGHTGELTVLTRARPVSVPFLAASLVLLAGLAGWSIATAPR